MRTLNDYFIPIGNIDLGTPNSSTTVCCPDGGRVIGVAYSTTEAIDVAGTCDVLVNGAEVTPNVDVDFPVTASNIGAFAYADSNLYIADGDSIQLTANAGPTTGIFNATLIIRR